MAVKFLIVDDSMVMRKLIMQTIFKGSVFNEQNTVFVQAADGALGVDMFKKEKPHIILSDWNMPNMDGFQMVQEIRKLDAKVPIIMITTEGTEDRVQKALAEGHATDYIVKPLQPGVLEKKLLKAFEALRGAQ